MAFKEIYTNEYGLLHREDGPAKISEDGTEEWYYNGLRHRKDGPAILNHHTEQWYLHGYRHREDGPAVISKKANHREWWLNGKLHRKDGPAIIFNSKREYYLYGSQKKYVEYLIQKAANINCKLNNDELEMLKSIFNGTLQVTQ